MITGDRKQRQHLLQKNYSFPQVYGMINPVVAFYTDPSYRLAKQLAYWFRTVTDCKSPYTIKNSMKLASKLQPLKSPSRSELMVILIPVCKTEELMADILLKKGNNPEIIVEFRDLLFILCLKYKLCVFKTKKYEFPHGLSMGGPLSIFKKGKSMIERKRHKFLFH